jgi:hypothetical protein
MRVDPKRPAIDMNIEEARLRPFARRALGRDRRAIDFVVDPQQTLGLGLCVKEDEAQLKLRHRAGADLLLHRYSRRPWNRPPNECQPIPFVITILPAASNNFAMPIGRRTNLMVYGPGGYRFSDYLPLGIITVALDP